jgi:hypothetical protein
MLQRVLTRLFSVLFGLVLGCGLCECALRAGLHPDADGNLFIRATHLRPFHPPLHRLHRVLAQYHGSHATAVVYDSLLGWDARPLAATVAGRPALVPGFRASRDPATYTSRAGGDTIRILLFGDSFTACATPESTSWGHALEADLRGRGIPVEVLNFGLGGYGIDQAYLRWRRYGPRYSPDLVIFGFQPENVRRDINVVRMIYDPYSGLPFSKPRFEHVAGRLELRNVPAAPPDSLSSILSRLADWPLLPLEGGYVADDYRHHWWLSSRFAAVVTAIVRNKSASTLRDEQRYYDPTGRAGALALAIVREFHDEVAGAGAGFLIAHLPRYEDVMTLREGKRPLIYAALLDSLERNYGVVDAAPELSAAPADSGLIGLFINRSHYNALGNRAVARALDRYFRGEGSALLRRRAAHGSPV